MAERKFPWGRTLLTGFGFLGISLIWPVFNQFIPILLQSKMGLTPALALFIMTWDNILNIFIQPWVGQKSDRTWNRFGRRKGWILLGAPIAAVGFVFIPVAQTVIAIMVSILITNLGMALFRSPTVAWLGDLFSPEERSKANGVINFMGGIGGLLAFVVGGLLFDRVGAAGPFVAGALAMLLALGVAVYFVREPERIEISQTKEKTGVVQNFLSVYKNSDKSGFYVLLGIFCWFTAFNALETGLSSFAVYTLKIPVGQAALMAAAVTISFVIFSIPAGLIAQRIGRRRTIQIGLTGLAALFMVGFFIIQNVVTFVGVLVLVGFFWAMVNVNSLPMVLDYGDATKIGAFTGMYYFASQLASVVGPTLGGVLVDILNDEYRWMFIFSTIFMALAWLVMTRVRERKLSEKSGQI